MSMHYLIATRIKHPTNISTILDWIPNETRGLVHNTTHIPNLVFILLYSITTIWVSKEVKLYPISIDLSINIHKQCLNTTAVHNVYNM